MLADEIKTVIFCDDIRKEITNKDILIGVYAGDIVVPSFPTPLALALWIEIDPKEVGTRELIFRVIAGKAEPFQFGIGIETITLGAASLAFSGNALAAPKIHWDCNAHGCIHCWEDLDGEHCQVVLK